MGGMRGNQGGRQPGNDEPGPAELQKEQHQTQKDEKPAQDKRPQSDCRDDEDPGDMKD